MSFVSYAQNFEDVLLWRALGHVDRGKYLDIGAQDPVHDSVSLAFYKAGWRGVHVEPTPAYAALLRAARPDETVIQAAVSAAAGPIAFYEIPETGLSTGRSTIAQHHSQIGYNNRELLVPTVRLSSLLQQTGEPHWLKIDVEGMEADVLASWDDCPIRPWLLVIEATFPNSQEQTDDEWKRLVLERGYEHVHFDGLSRYFLHSAHRDLADRFGSPPHVFDGFKITERHFAAGQLTERIAALDRDMEETAQRLTAADRVRIFAEGEVARLGQALDQALTSANDARQEVARLALERVAQLQALADAEADHRRSIEQARETEAALNAEVLDVTRQLAATQEAHAHQQLQERTQRLTTEAARDAAQAALAALQAEAASLETQLADVRTLISKALARSQGRWQRLGLALGLSREDPVRTALRAWPLPPPSTTTSAREAVIPAADPSYDARNPYLRADSLVELLSWDDVDFVRCAYVTVLGRQPDPQGEAYYTGRIRQGYSKLEVLWQLRTSSEGPSHDPGIAGFDRALRAGRWTRSMLGWPVRLLTGAEGNSASWRRHRALLNLLAASLGEQRRVLSEVQQFNAKWGTSTSTVPGTASPEVGSQQMPSGVTGSSTQVAPELDSRARHALELLRREAVNN